MRCVITFANIGDNRDKEVLIIATDVLTYTIMVVEKKEDISNENIKTRTFFGYENMEGLGTYIATVFFFYDISKNELIPDNIWLRIEGSPNILVFSGIIKLDE